jgi:hypothetical protein
MVNFNGYLSFYLYLLVFLSPLNALSSLLDLFGKECDIVELLS